MEKVCTSCGYVGFPIRITKGSLLIEIFLWLLVIIPGVIYSIWRLTSRYDACPGCKNASMIPIDSPFGQKLVKEYKPEFKGITKEEALRLWKDNPSDRRGRIQVVLAWERANKNE